MLQKGYVKAAAAPNSREKICQAIAEFATGVYFFIKKDI